MIEQETWRFVNTFAPWLSAVGTLAAVITSLYLSRRGDRIRLKLSMGIRIVVVQGGGSDHGTELIWLNITNIGRRSATITTLHWRPVPWRKSGLIWIAPQNDYSSPLPITLNDGQSANYASVTDEFRKSFSERAQELFTGMVGAIRLRLLRIYVYTSTGKMFSTRPEASVRDLLRTLATRTENKGKSL